MTKENKQRVTEVTSSEIIRHNTIKELIPATFCQLFSSAEYKKSLGQVYSLTYSRGFIDGVKAERKEEDVQKILEKVKRLNMDALSLWKPEYHKLFEAEYPYVWKFAEAYRVPLGDLMNLLPDEPVPKAVISKEILIGSKRST